MPRPNHGPRLVLLRQRGKYYIIWYLLGSKRVRSTGTADREKAEGVFRKFMEEREDLPPEHRHVEPAYDDVGPVRRVRDSFVYFIRAETGQIKIGLAENVERRLAGLRTHSPVPLQLLATRPGDRQQEWFYHQIFHRHRLHGEWFEPADPILDEIEAINRKWA